MIGVKSDSDSGVDTPDALGELADEFIQQYRSGMNPDIDDYCQKYPECASRIRDLFPMLLLVEDCGVAGNSRMSESSKSINTSQPAGLPERIGDFKIIREIGRGGMGIVYEAEQQSLRRRVALKVLPPSATLSPLTLERFRRESRAAARLHHSNIVPVFGVGEDDGLHYYVMQYIQGVGLDQVLLELAETRRAQLLGHSDSRAKSASSVTRSKNSSSSGSEDRLYWNRVAIIGLQLANALHFAHSQGVLHRDVKPANVLLDSDGLIWLTDFGLAQASDDANLTRSGDIVGTLRYLAPERLHGDGNQLSDVYGLGATLYELLALVPAFPETDRVTLIRQIAHQDPKRLRAIDPSIPRDLETIVMKAIEKEASRRYRSAAELAEDLSRFLSDRPILARRVVKLEQFWRWCRRNPTVTLLSSAVCLLMFGMLIAWSMFSWVQSDRDRARLAEQTANRAQQAAMVAEELAKARSHLALAIGYRHSRDPGHKSKCLAEIEAALSCNPTAETKAELRNVAVAALAQTDVKPGRSWHVGQDDTTFVAYDNSLSRFARMNAKGVISILNAQDLSEVTQIVLPATDRVLLSDQGGFFAAYKDIASKSCEVWSIERNERVIGPLSGSWDCDFDDLNAKILLWNGDSALHLYDLKTGVEIHKHLLNAVPTAVALSPDSKQAAFVLEGQPSTLHVFDFPSAQIVKKLTLEGSIHFCSWNPNGSQIACALAHPSNLEIWDLETEKKISTMVGHTQPVGIPCFTKDGGYVATGSWDGTLRVWETDTGLEIAVSTDGPLSHAGHQSVVAAKIENGVVSSLELDLPSGFTRLSHGNSANSPNFTCGSASPDGRWLVAGTTEGVETWDIVRGKRVDIRYGTLVRMLQVDWNAKRFQTAAHNAGFQNWPIEEAGTGWRVEQPKLLDIESTNVAYCSATPDGSRCAIVNENGVVRILTSTGSLVQQISGPDGHDLVNLSPNGKYLTTYGWHVPTSCVWDVDSGKLLLTLEKQRTFHSFSPDSSQMITSSASDYTFRSVDDWKVIRRIERKECVYPSSVAFSPDNSMIALELSWGVLHLLRTDNFETLAVLESPKRTRPSLFEFSGSGNTLFAYHHLTDEIHRWDIDGLQKHLASMRLDLGDDIPPNVNAKPTGSSNAQFESPASIAFAQEPATGVDEVELARQRILEAEKSFNSNPASSLLANQLAWYLVSAPSELQDADRALALLSDLQKSSSLDVNSRNTLAIAYYRVGKFSEAIDLLRENISIQADVYLPYDLYFLAMSYWKSGNEAKARETLEWSERMMRLKPLMDVDSQSELKRFRAEAKALIQ